ncbi:hypothetical protein [Leeuwenhoekiella aequorea]|uniref:Uncharacterized protein n=1 Tax=Leeuwenhoekiella aequorea TaxID=283736 RepID=A0A4Q0P5Q6_9FLAO|nr:hypothetical protein [Leeuwenhoekiella aequorea]RXG21967.1 hypothetical protein DSM00_2031 [Leeuwenhoekiella aequorea]
MFKEESFLRSKAIAIASLFMALVYVAAPLQKEILTLVHDLEHKFDHVTSSDHNHDFLNAEQLLAEAGHDHRTLEYIKQVLEPFGDDFQQEKKEQEPVKIDKHLPGAHFKTDLATFQLRKESVVQFIAATHQQLTLHTPSPPPKL